MFPVNCQVLMLVELTERLAYYGSVFTFSTYIANMLNRSQSESNLLQNILYAVTPIAAVIGSGLSDGLWGRRRTLFVFGVLYCIGLFMIATSATPYMYNPFPDPPNKLSFHLFLWGVMVLAAGYGGMKVSLSPLTADSLVHDMGQVCHYRLGRLFRWTYWMINFGSLIGIAVAPFMRMADPRTKVVDGDVVHTGYYYPFYMCFASCCLGLILYACRYSKFPENDRHPRPYFLFRVVGRAAWVKLLSVLRIYDDVDTSKHGFLQCALYKRNTGVTFLTDDDVVEIKTTVHACRLFLALPLYWLISNQFSINVVYQATWMNLPPSIPPEIFNNVNTVTLLVCVPLVDMYALPKLYGNKPPPLVRRLTFGFVVVTIAMLICGILQLVIETRGELDNDGNYTLKPGQEEVSAGWLVIPFMLQGIASVFVDTASLEAAYTRAPVSMKSTVMALYLMASSASGFLGLVIAPFVTPRNMLIVYFALAFCQSIVAAIFESVEDTPAVVKETAILEEADEDACICDPEKLDTPLVRQGTFDDGKHNSSSVTTS